MTNGTSVKIGAHSYQLNIDTNEELDCGSIDTIKCIINIHAGMPLSLRGATLIHEAMHGMNTTIGEEHIAHAFLDSFAEQMYSFLVDNQLLNMDRLEELVSCKKQKNG